MIERKQVEEFLKDVPNALVLDVRSPSEYNHAHIPGAITFPLFSDEERKVVGTAYKQQSRETAIKIGLDYFGPKMRKMVEEVEKLLEGQPKKVLVHCWRGGMRSGGVAWLLDLYGFEVVTLDGGYKAFRNWVLKQFTQDYPLKMVGGYTGSGKTEILKMLQSRAEQMIDIEGLANHKGSALGGINMPPQPSQEMFENLLAFELSKLDKTKPIWIEDESQRIGNRNIPNDFIEKMRQAKLYFLDVPFQKRLTYLVDNYGKLPAEKIVNAILRIKKRLGGLNTKNAINYLVEGEIDKSFAILLSYYDKAYDKALDKHEGQVVKIVAEELDMQKNTNLLLK
ncbi:tRNA 2-selenouridine(34) synthase MnmH [Jiulongibacter sediminis]|uniref:Rhodanese domain-containing protein n=1 Tax=Jiulongibacter sediminis TaxID=1605367 RepID=A0A0P7C1E2_9BACT|nr:tRNA 2-selenouridine(34) synthase MnmH [Jiulongibacter sediminis]KPM47801.1 hypothetical protein AFM12_11110 [Jiulongibacter sediminis]TBX23985.1 hypothetical protein TK44_11115 [Jiulongibacter sediminis]